MRMQHPAVLFGGQHEFDLMGQLRCNLEQQNTVWVAAHTVRI